ncbi:MAG: lipocalin-like domain-containing protein [Myxococcota bacterium]
MTSTHGPGDRGTADADVSEALECFYGVWQLREWSATDAATGRIRLAYNGRVDGHLIYSRDGWVSATLMELNRPVVSEDRHALRQLKDRVVAEGFGAIEQRDAALMVPYFLAGWGYVGYCGPFRVQGAEVFHEIRNSLVPQWTGTTLVRTFAFDMDARQLTLLANRDGKTDRLVWQRADSDVEQRELG